MLASWRASGAAREASTARKSNAVFLRDGSCSPAGGDSAVSNDPKDPIAIYDLRRRSYEERPTWGFPHVHLFFDLDGTLADSLPGIYRCISQALAELGYGPVSEGRVRALVATPLSVIFQALLDSTDAGVVDRAVAAYRARFDRIGLFESGLFPGIADALTHLRQGGHSLQVVTTKPAVVARRVVAHAGIAPCSRPFMVLN